METKKKWIVLNIALPILPLILRGVIKICMGHLDFEVINSSELFFVIAIIALIISQDLRMSSAPLDNEDKKKERSDRATDFLILFIVFVFFSAGSEIFHVTALEESSHTFIPTYRVMSLLSFTSAFITIKYSLKSQREFQLTAKFI